MLYKDFIEKIDRHIEESGFDRNKVNIEVSTYDKIGDNEIWSGEIDYIDSWACVRDKKPNEVWIYMR